MIHAAITLVFCVIILSFKLPVGLVLIPVAFYIGREHAQAEYRYIEAHGRKRANCPWWCGFMPEAWTMKGVMDFLLPIIVVMFAVVVYNLIKG